jgi:DNA repair protein SbcD/Mre11
MLKIIHTADWHLGQTFYSYDRSREHEYFLYWLLDTLTVKQPDALLIAGDVFDVANPSAAAQKMFYHFLLEASRRVPELQIIVIAGNHDSAARLEAPQPLLDDLKVTVCGMMHRFENGEIDYQRNLIPLYDQSHCEQALCLAIPYLRQGDYPPAKGYEEGVQSLYKEMKQLARQRMMPHEPLIAMGHFYATNAEIANVDASERLMVGGLDCVDASLISQDVAYTALGHIHKAQRVAQRENIRYAGSPIPMSFAERHYHHGVQLVTLEDDGNTVIERLDYEPRIHLLSLPEKGAYNKETITSELLQQLPQDLQEDVPPYLEIKIDSPSLDPMLKGNIAKLLEDKPIRFCRIRNIFVSTQQESEEERQVSLEQLTPMQLAQIVYKNSHSEENIPDELASLLKDVIKEVEDQA